MHFFVLFLFLKEILPSSKFDLNEGLWRMWDLKAALCRPDHRGWTGSIQSCLLLTFLPDLWQPKAEEILERVTHGWMRRLPFCCSELSGQCCFHGPLTWSCCLLRIRIGEELCQLLEIRYFYTRKWLPHGMLCVEQGPSKTDMLKP